MIGSTTIPLFDKWEVYIGEGYFPDNITFEDEDAIKSELDSYLENNTTQMQKLVDFQHKENILKITKEEIPNNFIPEKNFNGPIPVKKKSSVLTCNLI